MYTSLGKTPQTIAQSFEDSDEDETETHKEIANQVQVYHVGRTDCDNLQLTQEVQSTQKSSKQDRRRICQVKRVLTMLGKCTIEVKYSWNCTTKPVVS